jgi:glutaredoxin-related protein
MDEIEYLAKATPSHSKYNIKYDSVKLRSFMANLNRDKSERSAKLINDESPSPHSYEVMPSIKKFLLKKNVNTTINKAKDVNYID